MELLNHSYNNQYREHRSKHSRHKSGLISKRGGKTKNREKWSAKQTELVVMLWVENLEIIEYSRCNQVWPRIADKISTPGSSKTIKQCKVQICNLKDSCKKCKGENKKTGNERLSCPYFDNFDRVLNSRNVATLPEFCEAGAADKEVFQESPPHQETSAPKDDEEYNSPTNKRNFSDFEEGDAYSTEMTEESKQGNRGKVTQASKRKFFMRNY